MREGSILSKSHYCRTLRRELSDGKVLLVFDTPFTLKKDDTAIFDVKVDLASSAISSHVLGLELERHNDISLETNHPVIIKSDIELKYIEEVSDHIIIDGAFEDWKNIPGHPDTDPEPINNENIDLNEYRITNTDEDLSFYLRVDGTMMGGTYVPIKPEFATTSPEPQSNLEATSSELQVKTEIITRKAQHRSRNIYPALRS